MKKLVIRLASVAVLGIMVMLLFRRSDENRYLRQIRAIQPMELEGPEKSAFRDALMTMNPKTGEISAENVRAVAQSMNTKGRSLESKDFKWKQVDTEIAGRVRAIMIDPNVPNKLWAGAVTGGLWYSSDFRNNTDWQTVSDDWESLSISCIAYDPNDTKTYYVGTGESYTSVNIYRESSSSGVGIYKTIDGGATWSLLSSTAAFQYVNDIVVRDEDGKSVVYAGIASGVYQGSIFGSSPSDGLFRSEDGGTTWTQVLPDIEGSSVPYTVSDIELASSGDIYVGTMRNLEANGGGTILRSQDGINWEVIDKYAIDIVQEAAEIDFDVIPGRVRFASMGNMVYAAGTAGLLNNFDQIRDFGFFTRLLFKDGLSDWQYLDGPPSGWASIPWHAMALGVDPNDEEHLVIGGLNVHALSNARDAGSLSWVQLSDWASQYYFSDYLISYFGLENIDSSKNHFVHADIHSLIFASSSDELIASTDGGVQYTGDLNKGFVTLEGERLEAYPTFKPLNHSMATTQYYTIDLHPSFGNMEVIAGTQDNGTHTSESGSITYASMIGGGDGAYCFFDSDDLNLRITSSQVGNYTFWIDGDDGYFYGVGGGTFINPADYDDRSNLIYSNLAVDGGFEALSTNLEGRFLDSMAILNANKFLKKDDLGLDTLSYVKLGTNSTTSFSAIKVSPYSDELDATLIIGNQLGDVFKVEGLPYSPVSTKIDDDQLPVGYVSSIDIGENENEILVSFSNYGVTSIWYTRDGGSNWQNIERDLPDIPVRDAKFNPLDSDKVIIATELGVWGLESISDNEEGWQSYNEGLPNVRVDMLQLRASDKTIALATHGRGIFIGTFDQGAEPLNASSPAELTLSVYPNPTALNVRFNKEVSRVKIFSVGGRKIIESEVKNQILDLSKLNKGVYFLQSQISGGEIETVKVIKN